MHLNALFQYYKSSLSKRFLWVMGQFAKSTAGTQKEKVALIGEEHQLSRSQKPTERFTAVEQ